VGRLAVETKYYPLYEVREGQYHITHTPRDLPVTEYLKTQGRFRHLSAEETEKVQKEVDKSWARLVRRTESDETC
jgi:pyruvate/2-oxoacid:ferredoxin oxidoreductase beta subunit